MKSITLIFGLLTTILSVLILIGYYWLVPGVNKDWGVQVLIWFVFLLGMAAARLYFKVFLLRRSK